VTDLDGLNLWLISEGRLLGDATRIVKRYCESLVQLGVPLERARIAQSYSNPLLSAWGTIWTPEQTKQYTVEARVMTTQAWKGSPFEHVVTTRSPVRKKLIGANLESEHALYSELAATGATDFLAMPLEYGDGSVQGTSFTTNAEAGFSERDIHNISSTRHALAAALEPIAMRESQKSLLQTYLGAGPAQEIGQGHIKRGEHRTVSAAILFADLRNFTSKSDTWPEARLLDMMGDYFEMVVAPIQNSGGDVLKFMGDGILAIFDGDAGQVCVSAVAAARQSLANLRGYNAQTDRDPIEFVIGIDFGQVTFGNIGSPDRLDFTVVGGSVNIASRVQGLCKELGEELLYTGEVARYLQNESVSAGFHVLRGLPRQVEVFKTASLPGMK